MFVHAPTARSRSLIKAITWRAVGSTDTFIVGLGVALLFHHTLRHAASIAISISSVESITKVVLFYFHERVWARVQWGRADKVIEAAKSAESA